jgi:hypothetical protein
MSGTESSGIDNVNLLSSAEADNAILVMINRESRRFADLAAAYRIAGTPNSLLPAGRTAQSPLPV